MVCGFQTYRSGFHQTLISATTVPRPANSDKPFTSRTLLRITRVVRSDIHPTHFATGWSIMGMKINKIRFCTMYKACCLKKMTSCLCTCIKFDRNHRQRSRSSGVKSFILKLGTRDYVEEVTYYTISKADRFSGSFSRNR